MRPPERAKATETETTLVVVSDTPAEVAGVVAALSGLDGFALLARPDQTIHDRYFDTPQGTLAAARTALRLREVDSRLVLAIKGPVRPGGGAVQTRDEREADWPAPAWSLLHAELGTELGLPAAPPADAFEALRSAGLVVVGDRETLRRVRDVVPAGAERPVAELAVDAVVFHLGAVDARHHEIEIESKAEGGEAALTALAASLAARFGPTLRPWPYGKLTTGNTVARLIEERGRDDLLTADGSLRPASYDAIADLLARERAGPG
jgi:inorganic triphosphatase YgiF